jgi:DNA-binding NarL/FixJ family response regulator
VRTVHLVLADPFSVFRLGVKSVFREERDFEIAEVGSLGELEELVASGPQADIALVDLDLPPRGAFEGVALLRRTGTPAVVWSRRARLSPELVFNAVRVGAVGVLSKEISAPGLVRALRGVARGEAPLGRDIASLLIEGMHSASEGIRARSQIGTLSSREREVLEHVSEGRSNKEIAAALCVSEFTAKRHVQNILRKLGVHSRWEASASYYSFLETAPVTPRIRRNGDAG